jgi:hypothetical protein
MHESISTDIRTSSSRFQDSYFCLASYNELLGIMDSQIETAEQADAAERERLVEIVLRKQQDESDAWNRATKNIRPIKGEVRNGN